MLSDRAAVAQQTLSWKVPYIRSGSLFLKAIDIERNMFFG